MTVSVIMITYGHASYISQAIEGVLMQEVNFDIELIIADDCSPDNTQKVVEEWLRNHPKAHAVKYTKHLQNKGMQPNFIWAYQQCNGKYIALCEGDDYWTNPLKLQKQVDFLEKNQDFSFCCHRYKVYDQKSNTYNTDVFPLKFKPINVILNGVIIDKKEYHSNWITQPLTAVFRKKSLLKYDLQQFKYFRDVHLFYLLIKEGKGVCFEWVGGVYRHQEGGMHIGSNAIKRASEAVKIYEELYLYSKDIQFFKIYFANIFALLKSNKTMQIEALKSLFFNLSFYDKIRLMKFLVCYKLKF